MHPESRSGLYDRDSRTRNWKCGERDRHHKTLVFMGGHHEGIRIHYVFRRICIIGTVIKSPVEGHGNRIADCVQHRI